jgi:Domain of unknown function (DUF4157)
MTATALHTHRRPAPKPAHLHAAPSRRTAAAPPAATQAAGPAWPPYLQRRCACTGCGPCASGADTETVLQRRADGAASSTAAPSLSLGAGRPLPSGVRQQVEPLFGQSFTHVRLHDGPAAARATRAVGAVAFTSGAHIAFAPGRYAPHTPGGLHLLSHELAHTVQQRGLGHSAPLQRAALTIGAAHSPHEAEADRAADRVLQGQRVGALTPLAAPRLQRYSHAEPALPAEAGWAGALWRGARGVVGGVVGGVFGGMAATAGRVVQVGTAAIGRVVPGIGHVASSLAARAARAIQAAGQFMAQGRSLVELVVQRTFQATLGPMLQWLQLGRWWQILSQGLRAGAAALAGAALRWLSGHCAGLYQAAQVFEHWLGQQVQQLVAELSASWRLWGGRLQRAWAWVMGQMGTFLGRVMAEVTLVASTIWQALAPVREVVMAFVARVGAVAWQVLSSSWTWLTGQASHLAQVLRQAAAAEVSRYAAFVRVQLHSVALMAQFLLNGLPPQLANPLRAWARRTAQRWRRLWRALREGGPAGLLLQAVDELQADLALAEALCRAAGAALQRELQALGVLMLQAAHALLATPQGRLLVVASGFAMAGVVALGAVAVSVGAAVVAAWYGFEAMVAPCVAAVMRQLRKWRGWAQAALALAAQGLTEWWDDRVWQPLQRLLAWARATPCLRELLMVTHLHTLLSGLASVRRIVRALWEAARQPARLLSMLRAALAPRIARAPSTVAKYIAGTAFPLDPAHREGIVRHLTPAIQHLMAHWWQELLNLGGTLLWPWPAVGQALPDMARQGALCVRALVQAEWGPALQSGLAAMQQLNAALGALWGWFAIGAMLGGGFLGALGVVFSGGATLGAGAAAGWAMAGTAGLWLLGATVITEVAVIAQAHGQLSDTNPRLADPVARAAANEDAYGRFAQSTFSLGVLAALAVLGWMAGRLAAAIWLVSRTVAAARRGAGLVAAIWRAERPRSLARPLRSQRQPGPITAAELEAGRLGLAEVVDQPGRVRRPRDPELRSRYDLEVELEGRWRWRRDRLSGLWCIFFNPRKCGKTVAADIARRAEATLSRTVNEGSAATHETVRLSNRRVRRAEANRSAEAVRRVQSSHHERVLTVNEEISTLESAMSRLRLASTRGARPNLRVLTPAERELIDGLVDSGDAAGVHLRELDELVTAEQAVLRRELEIGDASEGHFQREVRRAGFNLFQYLRSRTPDGVAAAEIRTRYGGLDVLTGAKPPSGRSIHPDHVIPLTEMIETGRFRHLSLDEMEMLTNELEFLRSVDSAANESRGDRSYAYWPQANRFYTDAQLAPMRHLEIRLRVRLPERIEEILSMSPERRSADVRAYQRARRRR